MTIEHLKDLINEDIINVDELTHIPDDEKETLRCKFDDILDKLDELQDMYGDEPDDSYDDDEDDIF
jgi:hypothetical protein